MIPDLSWKKQREDSAQRQRWREAKLAEGGVERGGANSVEGCWRGTGAPLAPSLTPSHQLHLFFHEKHILHGSCAAGIERNDINTRPKIHYLYLVFPSMFMTPATN